MGDDFRDFGWLYATTEREIQIVWQLNCLIARNQGGDRDDAAVARIETGTLPHFTQKPLLRCIYRGRALPPECPPG